MKILTVDLAWWLSVLILGFDRVISKCIIFSEFFIWRIANFFDRLWKTDEWYIMTTSDNEWQRVVQQVVQQVITSGTASGKELQQMIWQMSYHGWSFRLIFLFLDNNHPKEKTMKRDNWIKTRNKPHRWNINSKKQKLRQLFCLWYIQLIYLLRWYDTNII